MCTEGEECSRSSSSVWVINCWLLWVYRRLAELGKCPIMNTVLTNIGQHNSPISPDPWWYGEATACLWITSQKWHRSAIWHFCDNTGQHGTCSVTYASLTGGGGWLGLCWGSHMAREGGSLGLMPSIITSSVRIKILCKKILYKNRSLSHLLRNGRQLTQARSTFPRICMKASVLKHCRCSGGRHGSETGF